jgi:hypothetical protein
MKHLIKFMLHAGRVPYFVADYESAAVSGEYVGQSHDDTETYLPDTVERVTADDVVAHFVAADLRDENGDQLSDVVKTQMAQNALQRWGA